MALNGGKLLGFFGLDGAKRRSHERADNRLGVVLRNKNQTILKSMRNPALDRLDAYYENRAYAGMPAWEQPATDHKSEYIPIRQRQPRIQMNFAKALVSKVGAKLVGEQNFPKFSVEADPEFEEYLRLVLKTSKLKSRIIEPLRRILNVGSGFVRFQFDEGAIKIEHFHSKVTTPNFMPNGELDFVEVKFIFLDEKDTEDNGSPKKKWFRLIIGRFQDVRFKPVEVGDDGEEPETWEVEEVADHNLGFVQGEWFRTAQESDDPDGPSLVGEITDFIDELNYNCSQSSQVIQFNQDPQLILSNMDSEEIGELIRSSQKGWNLGREGKAAFLESNLGAVETAGDFRDKVKGNIGDISRIILMDPEKMVAHAQSAKAMEVLHGPLVDLVLELRPFVQESLQNLLMKMALTNLILIQRGGVPAITTPRGFKPKSIEVTVTWPPVFPMTMQDLQSKVSVASTASGASIISRETALRFVAKDFGVENIEEEVEKINAQPVFNPFGAF